MILNTCQAAGTITLSDVSEDAGRVYWAVREQGHITIAGVCRKAGMTRRAVELATEEIRDAGVPLCSSTREPMGLYIARTVEEYAPYYAQLQQGMSAAEGTQLALALETAEKAA
jgi:hypothetical protein